MTLPACSCGTRYKREWTRQVHCPACVAERRAQRASKSDNEPTPSHVTAKRLHQQAHAEPGWPKGIVEYRGHFAIVCDQRLVNRYAHNGMLVGVLDERGTIEDVQSMVSA